MSQFSFYFDSSQDKRVRSGLHGDDFTTSYNPTTQIIDKFYCTVYYTTFVLLSIATLYFYYYYDTGDFNSVYTTYFIGSIVNIL